MSIKLVRVVYANHHLPSRWKPLLALLAFTARHDDGSGIFKGVEKLARELGLHRVTVSKLLAEIEQAELVTNGPRGGRRRSAKGVVKGLTTRRRLDPDKIAAFGCSRSTTKQAAHVAARLHPNGVLCSRPTTQIESRSQRKTVEPEKDLRKLSPPSAPTRDGQEAQDAKVAAGRCVEAFYAAYVAKHDDQPVRMAKNVTLMRPLVDAYGEARVLMLIDRFFGDAQTRFDVANSNQDVAAFAFVAQKINVMDDAPALSSKTRNNLTAAAGAMGVTRSKRPQPRPSSHSYPPLELPGVTPKKEAP